MITPRMPWENEIKDRLQELGFEETTEETATGTFWKHTTTEQHLLVPFSMEGLYPDWLFNEALLEAESIAGQKVKQWPGWLGRPQLPSECRQ